MPGEWEGNKTILVLNYRVFSLAVSYMSSYHQTFDDFVLDWNECLGSPCDNNAMCVNLPGSFICFCNEGYSGDGTTCEAIDKGMYIYTVYTEPFPAEHVTS